MRMPDIICNIIINGLPVPFTVDCVPDIVNEVLIEWLFH